MMKLEGADAACITAQLTLTTLEFNCHLTNLLASLCNCLLKVIGTTGIGTLFHKSM